MVVVFGFDRHNIHTVRDDDQRARRGMHRSDEPAGSVMFGTIYSIFTTDYTYTTSEEHLHTCTPLNRATSGAVAEYKVSDAFKQCLCF